jgi:hypothetical protein
MKYLGLDVGLTTGVAIVDEHGFVERHFTVVWQNTVTPQFLSWVEYTKRMGFAACAEYPEPNMASRTRDLVDTMDTFHMLFPDAYAVRPGVWKTSAIGQGPLPEGVRSTPMSPHEKDAIRIALWYREYRRVHADG